MQSDVIAYCSTSIGIEVRDVYWNGGLSEYSVHLLARRKCTGAFGLNGAALCIEGALNEIPPVRAGILSFVAP